MDQDEPQLDLQSPDPKPVPVGSAAPSAIAENRPAKVGGRASQRGYIPMEAGADLVDRIVAFLAAHRPELATIARGVEAQLRAEFGGGDHYVRAVQVPRDQRVDQVLSAFNGRNCSEVARELGISRVTVWRRLRQAGKR
jgi:hypothetical protein